MDIWKETNYRRSPHFVIFGTKRVSRNSGITNFETLFSTKIPNWVQNFSKVHFFSYFFIQNAINCFWLSKNEKLAKKVDFRKFLDPIWDLALKRVSKFVIPEFRDTLLVPKITKCGDLLYSYFNAPVFSWENETAPLEKNSPHCLVITHNSNTFWKLHFLPLLCDNGMGLIFDKLTPTS